MTGVALITLSALATAVAARLGPDALRDIGARHDQRGLKNRPAVLSAWVAHQLSAGCKCKPEYVISLPGGAPKFGSSEALFEKAPPAGFQPAHTAPERITS
jgi:hypothetical protein